MDGWTTEARTIRLVVGATACASGAALLTYILSGVSLLGAVAVMVLVGVTLSGMLLRRAGGVQQAALRRRLGHGVIGGLAATAVYDAVRLVLVRVLGFDFWPFDVFGVFGRALLGDGSAAWLASSAGVAYHLLNGVGFGLAFAIWTGDRASPAWGVAWALVLEALMVSVYPGWLGLRAVDEFLSVSITGHLAYGLVLGAVCAREARSRATGRPR